MKRSFSDGQRACVEARLPAHLPRPASHPLSGPRTLPRDAFWVMRMRFKQQGVL